MAERRPRGIDLDARLRERPPGGPEGTDQDRYYDSPCGYVGGTLRPELEPPWTDDLDDHEAEL